MSCDSYECHCLVIYSTFTRCSIPVIIMGETGCGKTRLVRFLCELQKPRDVNVQNLVLMKVRRIFSVKEKHPLMNNETNLFHPYFFHLYSLHLLFIFCIKLFVA